MEEGSARDQFLVIHNDHVATTLRFLLKMILISSFRVSAETRFFSFELTILLFSI